MRLPILRSTDRCHRNLYNTLVHKHARYGQRIPIQPALSHWPVYLQAHSDGLPHELKQPGRLSQAKRIEVALFSVLAGIEGLDVERSREQREQKEKGEREQKDKGEKDEKESNEQKDKGEKGDKRKGDLHVGSRRKAPETDPETHPTKTAMDHKNSTTQSIKTDHVNGKLKSNINENEDGKTKNESCIDGKTKNEFCIDGKTKNEFCINGRNSQYGMSEETNWRNSHYGMSEETNGHFEDSRIPKHSAEEIEHHHMNRNSDGIHMISEHGNQPETEYGQSETTSTHLESATSGEFLSLLKSSHIIKERSNISTISSALAHLSSFSPTDVVAWILSLQSPTVSEACSHLTNHKAIPCIVVDTARRSPRTAGELELQWDLWSQYLPNIASGYLHKEAQVKQGLENLAYYAVKYSPELLPTIVGTSIPYFGNKMSPEYLNRLIWEISRYHLLSARPSGPFVKTLETILGFLRGPLSFQAYMGIAITLHGNERSLKLVQAAEKRYMDGSCSLSNMDYVAYNVAKMMFAQSPEELLVNFNNSHKYADSQLVWVAFLRKLDAFGILSEDRSARVAQMIISKHEKVLSGTVVKLLLKPFNGLTKLDRFLSSLPRNVALQQLGSILPVYIRILCINHKAKVREVHQVWDKKYERLSTGYKGFKDPYTYACHLYRNVAPQKTQALVGAMMLGEAIANPRGVYSFYQQELGGMVPSESCLLALVRASMKSVNGSVISWGDLYAPQVAIHEFRKHVCRENMVSDATWQAYIRMLVRYEYVGELGELVKWWEREGFVPRKETLVVLLRGLPEEYARRYVRHFGEVGGWEWPSENELALANEVS